jgi:hypothetical protein
MSMRHRTLPLLAALFAVQLAGCSTTDALTPPEPIGDESSAAAPTKQSAANMPPDSAPSGQGASDVAAEQPVSLAQEEDQQVQGNTMQQPHGSPMLGTPGGISATQKSIYHSETEQQQAQLSGSISFLPIIGAPLAAVTPLSRELSASAQARGLEIKPTSNPGASNLLKGYFSAYQDGSNTAITYVWDVLDASGGRLTRLQGQEKVRGGGNDPWANVPPETMQKIANDTISKYISWKSGSSG